MIRRPGRPCRSGFTLLEVVAVIAIIGLLAAVLLPAVQSARESARRIECLSHLHELGTAISNYEAQHRVLPPERVEDGFRSALTELLPHIEQAALYHDLAKEGVPITYVPEDPAHWGRPVLAILRCPSDGAAAGTNYRFNHGPDVMGGSNGKRRGPLSTPAAPSSIVTDGLSNTVAMSEALMSAAGPHAFDRADAWYTGIDTQTGVRPTNADVIALCEAAAANPTPFYRYVGHDWPVSGLGHAGYNHVLPPNPQILNCRLDSPPLDDPVTHYWPYGILSASSHHKGGVNILMLDGSARFASDGIAIDLWQAISTIADGETIGAF